MSNEAKRTEKSRIIEKVKNVLAPAAKEKESEKIDLSFLHMEDDPEKDNLFSNWFPKVKDCGITVPRSIFMDVPDDIIRCCFMERDLEDYEIVTKWVKDEVYPKIKEASLMTLLFVKNGTYSNKFDARYCMCLPYELPSSILNINYQALAFGNSSGCKELVIRERFQRDMCSVPCIYNGLPLRPEFRVFYDFDKEETIFTANYWDKDSVRPYLHDKTDQIVFDTVYPKLNEVFEVKKEEIQTLVSEKMKNVSGLKGSWSVDIMLLEDGSPILIDMATAERSAYWEKRPQGQ